MKISENLYIDNGNFFPLQFYFCILADLQTFRHNLSNQDVLETLILSPELLRLSSTPSTLKFGPFKNSGTLCIDL